MEPEIVVTQDGSPTLYSPRYRDHYHSTHGAVQESRHVFIEAGLNFCQTRMSRIRLLEVGLGTGLNLLLTVEHRRDLAVEYTAVETEPLPAGIVSQINYGPWLKGSVNALYAPLHAGPWEQPFALEAEFTVTKRNVSVLDYQPDQVYDLIYFDAFSPAVQPELWSPEVFARLSRACGEGAVLVTYSCKGDVRRALAQAGFLVEKLPGPPGKRQMLRAVRSAAPGVSE